ncbi:MAG: hypothetical protein LBI42_07435 [Chitinispirillales bacterium]|jgi:hypothetical protein|nr:hypothetical protein [Chitinispirillales bacterium]
MSKLKAAWNILQKVFVYSVLSLVLVISFFPKFFSWISNYLPFVDNNDPKLLATIIFFFSMVFFFMYIKFDVYMMRSKENFRKTNNAIDSINFIECFEFSYAIYLAFAYALKRDGKIKSIDIFARTTKMYYECIERMVEYSFHDDMINSNLKERLGLGDLTKLKINKIGKLRILVPQDEILKKHHLEFKSGWSEMKNKNGEKLCQNVEINRCDLFSANHYAIINNKYIIEGLYKKIMPAHDGTAGDNLLKMFIHLDRSHRDEQTREDRENHFKHNFSFNSAQVGQSA